jgi:hypothetical protein
LTRLNPAIYGVPLSSASAGQEVGPKDEPVDARIKSAHDDFGVYRSGELVIAGRALACGGDRLAPAPNWKYHDHMKHAPRHSAAGYRVPATVRPFTPSRDASLDLLFFSLLLQEAAPR